jgi:hypothetical protein
VGAAQLLGSNEVAADADPAIADPRRRTALQASVVSE